MLIIHVFFILQACDVGEEKEQALEPVEDDGWTVVKKK